MGRTTHRYSVIAILVLASVALMAPAARATGEFQSRPSPVLAVEPEAPSFDQVAPVAPPARTGHEVVLEVGDHFDRVVRSHPAGTHFRIAAGVHHGQSVDPRDGDVFIGDAGAVMTGAVPLPPNAFSRQGGVWVAAGQTGEAYVHRGEFHGRAIDGHERVLANSDLWAGDERLVHVNSRAEVDRPGEWFFDYGRDEVVTATDPAVGLALATAWDAFRSDARDVTIAHVTITRYGSYAQHGAIHAGEGWDISHVTVTENHGAGVKLGPNSTLTNARVNDNGQIGVTAWYGEGIRVEHNEIAGNLTLPYHWEWEGGGTKFKETDDLVFANNHVHANHGPGIWFDIDNRRSIVRSNLVEDNLIGILMEISYGATLTDNQVYGNGAEGHGDVGAGLWISNSSDVETAHNHFAGNRLEILATQYERGDGADGRYTIQGTDVHDNLIELTGVKPTGPRVYTDHEKHMYYDGSIDWQGNTYVDGGAGLWWDGDRSLAEWQALGSDLTGSFATASTSAVRTPYTPQPRGAA